MYPVFRFFSKSIKVVLGDGYPYFIKPSGKIVSIHPIMVDKEPDFKEEKVEVGVHVNSRTKDSKGKDIYESDILEYKGKRYEVFFKKGCFFIESDENKPILLGKLKPEEITVVGNSVQNPIRKEDIKQPTPEPDYKQIYKKKKGENKE